MYMYVCCHLKGQGKNWNYMKPPNISTKSRSLWQSELPMLTNVGGQHTVDQLHICVGPMPLGAARDAKKMTSEIDMKQKDEELLSLVYVPSGSMILNYITWSFLWFCNVPTIWLHPTLIYSYQFLVILCAMGWYSRCYKSWEVLLLDAFLQVQVFHECGMCVSLHITKCAKPNLLETSACQTSKKGLFGRDMPRPGPPSGVTSPLLS